MSVIDYVKLLYVVFLGRVILCVLYFHEIYCPNSFFRFFFSTFNLRLMIFDFLRPFYTVLRRGSCKLFGFLIFVFQFSTNLYSNKKLFDAWRNDMSLFVFIWPYMTELYVVPLLGNMSETGSLLSLRLIKAWKNY